MRRAKKPVTFTPFRTDKYARNTTRTRIYECINKKFRCLTLNAHCCILCRSSPHFNSGNGDEATVSWSFYFRFIFDLLNDDEREALILMFGIEGERDRWRRNTNSVPIKQAMHTVPNTGRPSKILKNKDDVSFASKLF